MRSVSYALASMRTTPDIQAKLRARLRQAVEQAGSADELGRLLGWKNGGPVRLCLSDTNPRNVTTTFIFRANESPATWLHGWFAGILPPIPQVDLMSAAAKRATKDAWPFERLTRTEWDRLGPKGQAIVEDAAATKARELLHELSAAARKHKARA